MASRIEPFLRDPEVYEANTINGPMQVTGVATEMLYDIEVAETARRNVVAAIHAWIEDHFGMPEIGDDFPDNLIREGATDDDSHLDLVYIFQDDVEREMRKLAFFLAPQQAGRVEMYFDAEGNKIYPERESNA